MKFKIRDVEIRGMADGFFDVLLANGTKKGPRTKVHGPMGDIERKTAENQPFLALWRRLARTVLTSAALRASCSSVVRSMFSQ